MSSRAVFDGVSMLEWHKVNAGRTPMHGEGLRSTDETKNTIIN